MARDNMNVKPGRANPSSVSNNTIPTAEVPKQTALELAEAKKLATTKKYIEFLCEFHHWADQQKRVREDDLHEAGEAMSLLKKRYEQEVIEGDPRQEETAESIESAEEHMASVIEFNNNKMAMIESAVSKVEQSARDDVESAILEFSKLQKEVS